MPHSPTPSSRRSFLKTSGLASALTLSGASALMGQDETQAPLKIGVVGLGGRGNGAVYDSINADPGTVLWAIADVDESVVTARTQEYKEKFGKRAQLEDRAFTGFDSFQKVIDSGIDVLVLATPPAFRPGHIKAGFDAGKHVFAEKPWCVDAKGLHQVSDAVRAANKKGLSFMTGLVWRHTAEAQHIYSMVNAGDIGDVLCATGYYQVTPPPITLNTEEMPHLYDYVTQKRWFGFVELAGDWVLEQFIHSVDKLGWAMGDQIAERCYGTGGAQPGHTGSNTYDHFNITYDYSGGRRALLNGSRCGKFSTVHDEVFGTKGQTFLGHGKYHATVDGKVVYKGQVPRLGYVDEHTTFYQKIRKKEVYSDIDQSFNTHQLALMARLAAYSGQEIYPEDIMESEEQLFDSMASFSMKSTFSPMPRANPFTYKL